MHVGIRRQLLEAGSLLPYVSQELNCCFRTWLSQCSGPKHGSSSHRNTELKRHGQVPHRGTLSSLCTLIRDENLTQKSPSRCHIMPPSMQLVSVTVSCKKGRERKYLAFKFLISGRQMSKKGLGNRWRAGHHQDLRSIWSNQIGQLQRLPQRCLLWRSSVSFEFLCAHESLTSLHGAELIQQARGGAWGVVQLTTAQQWPVFCLL